MFLASTDRTHHHQQMAKNHEVLEDIYKQIDQQELSYNDLKSLNQYRKATDNLILYMNIRGLKTNFEKLQILNKRLRIKPYVQYIL